MKKILSFMLVLAMLAMMCINVAAADHLVGTFGVNGNVGDGVASWTETVNPQDGYPIQATVTTTNEDRYAVDLVYTAATITITSEAKWNVNSLQYEGTTTVSNGTHEVEYDSLDAEGNGAAFVGAGSFAVTNYSSAAVEIYMTAAMEADYDAVTVGLREGTDENAQTEVTSNAPSEIEGADAKPGETGVAYSKNYVATLTCADWAATFAVATSDAAVTLATVTFTVAPATNAAGPNA